MDRIQPISPKAVQKLKNASIDPLVIKAVNELIVENWGLTSATVKQEDVITRYHKLGGERTKKNLFASKQLDIEPLFRDHGWTVVYDKPAYNESYDAYFEFSIKSKE